MLYVRKDLGKILKEIYEARKVILKKLSLKNNLIVTNTIN